MTPQLAALAGAYGTAVSTTMLLTTALLYNVMRVRWRWPAGLALTAGGAEVVVTVPYWAMRAALATLGQGTSFGTTANVWNFYAEGSG
jgi:K+ transporter